MSALAIAPTPTSSYTSISRINAYMRCPKQFMYRYVEHVPPSHRPSSFAFGSAIHTALALLYERLRQDGQEPQLEEFQQAFTDAWTDELAGDEPVVLAEGESVDGLAKQGRAMLEVFLLRAPRPHEVVAVEAAFEVELQDPVSGEVLPRPLVGIVDAIVKDEDGRHHVLEHKTAKRRFTETKLQYDIQPTAYAMAAQALGFSDVDVRYQVLLKLKKPALEIYKLERSRRDQSEFVSLIAGVQRAVEAGAFYANRDWHCQGCQWAAPCVAG